eukprot:4224421-Pyramimonas_sp.AAC.1
MDPGRKTGPRHLGVLTARSPEVLAFRGAAPSLTGHCGLGRAPRKPIATENLHLDLSRTLAV